MLARAGDPDARGLDPALALVRLGGDETDVVEGGSVVLLDHRAAIC